MTCTDIRRMHSNMNMPARPRFGRILRGVLLVVLLVCIAVVVSLFLHNANVERQQIELEATQNEFVQELQDNEGRYDAQSIVLANTSESEAKALAEKLGAKLRITNDGSFATLTLPEGVTILDVAMSEDYLADLPRMSADYEARISDMAEEDEEASDERLPMHPTYAVSDTGYELQTYLDYLNMQDVWASYTGSGVTIAVIDTGIDTDHPEFAGRISEYSYNATEDKIVKDYVLENGEYDWSLVEDEQGHGTAVTGVIAAAMDGAGTVGIAPNVTIITIKAECNEDGMFERTSDLVFGLYYAIERDVSVVNMSFGGESNAFAEATQLAYDSDVICVAAAGNEATATLTYPAADENVFGIGALAQNSWELAEYSNYGENVDFVAPGTVYTTNMGGGYGGMNGTSFASSTVAGVLALYMSQNKYSEFKAIEELIYASCYDLGDLGPDWYYGYGALDVSALLLEERGTVTFNMMTDELHNTEQIFIRTHTLQNMPEPERLYAIFDGWYYDPQCTEEYVWYEDELHNDFTLYARWVNEDDDVPFTYVELEDGTIEICSYTGHRRYITIPDYIDGKVVSSIGVSAFKGETRLREVKLPKYLKRISASAFSECSNLVSMEIPDTVTEIGDKAFYDNVRLATITFGQNSQLVIVGDYAFSRCAKMRTFTVPSQVTTLNATAFYGNTSMMAYDVQNGNMAFSTMDGVLFNYTGDTLVCYPAGVSGTYTMPERVKNVGEYAFGYTRLSGVDLAQVQSLGDGAFICGALESIVIPDTVTSMGDSVFSSNYYLSSATLSASLTEISRNAFDGTALNFIEIPAGIQRIESGSFHGTRDMSQIIFADNSELMYIGVSAFSGSGLVTITIPASVTTIDNYAFHANLHPTIISFTFETESSLQKIGINAFEDQSFLSEIKLPEGVKIIGAEAFKNTGLQTVIIPESVSSLGAGAFASCHSLTDIWVEDGNANYLDIDGVVYNTPKDMIVAYPAGNARISYAVLEGVTDIGEASFYGSWNLQYVDLASTVVTVRKSSFYGCKYVTGYGLSDELTYIQETAFSKNHSLRSMHMPDSLMQIGRYAFAENWNLSSVTFTENAQLPRISFGAFAYCGLTSFRVPANVSTMAQSAFMGCDQLTSFTFARNSKLESISAYMFDGCSNLRTITFEQGSALTSIQAHGLEGMRKLTTIDLGDAKLTNIDNFAFRFCESLSRFDIPEGVTFLGRYAFYYCTNLSEVTVPSTMDFIGRFAFLGTKELNVYFAAETLPAHLAEDWDHGTKGYYLGVTDVITEEDWKYAKLTSGDISIIEYLGDAAIIDLTALNLGGDIVNIGGGAFADSTVESIVLPETLQIIQAEAFAYSNLQSVALPASVTFIGREAFAYTPIEGLTFAADAQLKTIEQSAFEKTESLEGVVIPASLTTIGRAVFKSSGIRSLTFAEGFAMTEIPEEAFAYTHLAAVTIPDSVTLINHNAFREIKELKSVTLGGGEDLMIMSNVFYQSGLETVYIPENVGYMGEYAFVALPNLTEFTVSENNAYYKAVDGLLVSKNGRKLIAVPAGRKGSLTVPEGIEVIGFGAFEDSKLSEIKFLEDANILSFGYRAFYNADGITEMHIPASVMTIDYYAFAMCDSLQTVTFAKESNLKGVYEGAFYGCKNLSDVTIPDSIVEISEFAFYGCRKLKDVPVSETSEIKGIYDYAFAYAGLSGDYTMPETLVDIGAYAFMGNRFTSLTVPETNYWDLIIGIGAFEDCGELAEISVPFIGASFEDDEICWFGYIFGAGSPDVSHLYIPETLKKATISSNITFIGQEAFMNVSSLKELVLPYSVRYVYPRAFENMTASYTLTNEITTIAYDPLTGAELYEAQAGHFGIGLYGELKLADGMTKLDGALRNTTNLESVVFPETMTYIGAGTFYGCGINQYRIPSHITYIGQKAFDSMDLVDVDAQNPNYFAQNGIVYDKPVTKIVHMPTCVSGDVVIPKGVTQIDSSLFSRNELITSVSLPETVESIGSFAFGGCTNLISVNIPEKVTVIAEYLFADCPNLKSVDLHDGITEIEVSAFENCTSLNSIYFGNGLKVIAPSAFCNCDSLTEIFIPAGVTSVAASVSSGSFIECDSLEKITVAKENQMYFSQDGVMYEKGTVNFVAVPCKLSGEVAIPDGVTEIPMDTFQYMDQIRKISIPDSVLRIEMSAFYGCSRLTTVEFGEGVTQIGYSAFADCTGLQELVIPDSVRMIDGAAFAECTSLLSVVLGSGVESIAGGAFRYCNSLEMVENHSDLPLFLGAGSYYAYGGIAASAKLLIDKYGNRHYREGAENFAYIDTVDGFRFIKENGVYKLVAYLGSETCVILPESIEGHTYNFDSPTGFCEVIVPESLANVDWSFSSCTTLTHVTLPKSMTVIPNGAFYGCTSLESVILPISLTHIGDSAFQGCTLLADLEIPDSLVSIGQAAFQDCVQLTTVHLGPNVSTVAARAFSGLHANVTLDPTNTYLIIQDGVMYSYDKTRCLSVIGSPTAITIPYGVTAIGNSAFSGLSDLITVAIPDSVTSIGDSAFSGCTALTEIVLPDSVTSIGRGAFYGCGSLEQAVLSDHMTVISGVAFYDCYSLTSVTFPENLQRIEASAFSGCKALEKIILPENVSFLGDYAFADCLCLRSFAFSDKITQIPTALFDACAMLTEVKLPAYLTEIGQQAFRGSGLERIVIPDSVISIGDQAFADCLSLRFVTLGIKVSNMSSTAFERSYIKKLSVLPGNMSFTERDGVLYDKEMTRILMIPDGITELVIPATVTSLSLRDNSTIQSVRFEAGSAMTEIADYTFDECIALTEVILPDSIKRIGRSAFYGCESLKSIVMPNTVETVDRNAFAYCESLTSVTLSTDLKTISNGAFWHCYALSEIELPDGLETIGDQAFYYCSKLQRLDIPATVANIGYNITEGCTELSYITKEKGDTSYFAQDGVLYDSETGTVVLVSPNINGAIVVPEGIQTLDVSLGDNVTSINIPSSVTKMEEDFKTWCGWGSSLRHITVHPDNPVYMSYDGVLYDKASMEILAVPRSIQGEVTVPEGVTVIDGFGWHEHLTSVHLPESARVINDQAFSDCISLRYIIIPDGVQKIGNSAFGSCDSLVYAHIGDGVTTIQDSAFYGSPLIEVVLGESLTYIDDWAFIGCNRLYYVHNRSDISLTFETGDITYKARVIEDKYGNRAYASEEYQDFTFVDVDDFRFFYCQGQYTLVAYLGSDETVTLPLEINGNSYDIEYMTGVKNLIIPEGVTHVSNHAFTNQTILTSVVFPSSLKAIGSDAFCNTGLTSINLPDGVTTIGGAAFQYTGLTSVYIPDSVMYVGDYAFSDCQNLHDIRLPEGMQGIGRRAFSKTAFDRNPDNWQGNALYIGDYLIRVASDAVYYDHRENTRLVAGGAFEGCYKLKSVTLMTVEWGCLVGMSNLETVVLHELPDSISNVLFVDSVPITLKNIVLKSGVKMNLSAFERVSDIIIYVEDSKNDTRWDENFLGWHYGNRVVYGDKWINVTFFDHLGQVAKTDFLTSYQIVRQPYCTDSKDDCYYYLFQGYDLNEDGIVDTVPATSVVDLRAHGVYEKVLRCDVDGHVGGEQADCFHDQTCSVCGTVLVKQLGHEYAIVEAQVPTCTNPGYKVYCCVRCNDTYLTDVEGSKGHHSDTVADCENDQICTICGTVIQKKFGHTPAVAVVENNIDSTCTIEGSYDDVVYCDTCGKELSRNHNTVPAKGHCYGGTFTLPTCTEQGYWTYTCSYCTDTYVTDEVAALGHNMSRWYQTVAPTCTTEGENKSNCVRCEYIATEVVSANGHTPAVADVENHVVPTCTIEGSYDEVVYCNTCRDELSRNHNIVPATGHSHAAVITAPTCTEQGYTTHTCHCGDIYVDSYVNKLGHTEVVGDAVAPTCTETGLTESKHCSVCSEVLVVQEVIPANGHTYESVVTAPTCTAQGYTTHTCHCGDVYVDTYVDALGHTEAVTEVVAPTCTETGLTEGKHCSVCNEVLLAQEVIPATGHTYEGVVTDPTCTEKGYTTHTCHCGDTYVDSEVEALGHTPSDWIVDVEAQIGVAGSKHKECTACGETLETEVIEALTEAPTTEAPTIEPPITEPESEQETALEAESDTDSEKSGGCNGTISASVALLALLSCFAVAWRPRKDN